MTGARRGMRDDRRIGKTEWTHKRWITSFYCSGM